MTLIFNIWICFFTMCVLQCQQEQTHIKGGQHVFPQHSRLINVQKLLLVADFQFEKHLKSHVLLCAELILRMRYLIFKWTFKSSRHFKSLTLGFTTQIKQQPHKNIQKCVLLQFTYSYFSLAISKHYLCVIQKKTASGKKKQNTNNKNWQRNYPKTV